MQIGIGEEEAGGVGARWQKTREYYSESYLMELGCRQERVITSVVKLGDSAYSVAGVMRAKHREL